MSSALRFASIALGAAIVPLSLSAQADTSHASDSTRSRAADSARLRALAPVHVTGRLDDLTGIATSASEGRVGSADLRLRPLQREGELLESVPGMIVTQHSGDGKANQLFVRGFNLDHGTDFQTRLDGMPLNMPAHAHGQGYTDLNFLIPELVESLEYRLGVQHASIGDFGSAGGAEFHLARSLARPFASVEGGQFGFVRVATGASSALGSGSLLAAGELKGYDGPWARAEALRKLSGIVRYAWGSPRSQFTVTAMAYHNTWNASDQIPLRAVQQGLIGAFGQVDSTLGGASERYSLSAQWRHVGAASTQLVQAFGVLSALDLYSNFTYDLSDSATGDQFNQREHRAIAGINATHVQPFTMGDVTHTLTLGVQVRSDVVTGVGLYRTRQRQRISTVRQDDVQESSVGLFGELESRWTPWFRSVLGLRGDGALFDVASDNPANSGSQRAAIASPKASFVFTPTSGTELYASAGLGFHSNDARGTTIRVDPVTGDPVTPVTPLVRSRGGELGMRTSPLPGWRVTAAVWALSLDGELLFSGDGGTTEPAPPSDRAGITIANFYRPSRTLAFDLDVSVARARFRDVAPAAQFVPGALENVLAAGVTLGGAGAGPFASLRVRHFDAYPLVESNLVRAQPSTLLNGEIGWQLSNVRVQLSVLNLLNSNARDIQYFYSSRLSGEPGAGVDDVHFHPAEPRQLRLAVRWER